MTLMHQIKASIRNHDRHFLCLKGSNILNECIFIHDVISYTGCMVLQITPMYGCCFGAACDLPWAIQFPAYSPAYGVFGQAPEDASHSVHVHPTQIYSALLNLALYGGLAWLYRRKRFDGQVFAVYLAGYSVNRFVVEFFRGDYQTEQQWFDWIKPGQQLSLFLLPIGIALFVAMRRRARG